MTNYDEVFSSIIQFANKYDVNIQFNFCGETELMTIKVSKDHDTIERNLALTDLNEFNVGIFEKVLEDMCKQLYTKALSLMVSECDSFLNDAEETVSNLSNYAGITGEKMRILEDIQKARHILGNTGGFKNDRESN